MTLEEFVDFFFSRWSLLDCLEVNFEGDQSGSLTFFDCESLYYPDFDQYCRFLVVERFPLREEDDEEDGDFEELETPISDVEVLEVTGVSRVGVWIRVYRNVYKVETTRGPAYLLPPYNNGVATIKFGPLGLGAGETLIVRLSKEIESELERLKPDLEALK